MYHSDAEASASWSTQDQSSAFKPHGKESVVRLRSAITESRTHVYLKVPATLKGHSMQVCAVAFSPDGKLIAPASVDMTVRLWNTATGAPRATLEGHSNEVSAVAFSPDSKLIASASGDTTVRLWDSATRAARATRGGHSQWVSAVAFSPDGKLIASASEDMTIRLWDPALEIDNTVRHLGYAIAKDTITKCLKVFK